MTVTIVSGSGSNFDTCQIVFDDFIDFYVLFFANIESESNALYVWIFVKFLFVRVYIRGYISLSTPLGGP